MTRPSSITRSQKIGMIIGMQLTLLLAALDQTIVATAMPRITDDDNRQCHRRSNRFAQRALQTRVLAGIAIMTMGMLLLSTLTAQTP